MSKNKANGASLPPISMEVYRQLVFDTAAHLSDGSWGKDQAMNYLLDLADRPIKEEMPAQHTVKENAHSCMDCRNCGFSSFAEGCPNLACGVGEDHFSLEEDHTAECPSFRSRYIQYPIQVNAIDLGGDWSSYLREKAQLVEVRPAGGKETYLGFLLGDFPMSASVSYNQKTGALKVYPFANPAIFVPALGKIVFGCESWWRRINSIEDAPGITDKDIENTWYVQALKELTGKERES